MPTPSLLQRLKERKLVHLLSVGRLQADEERPRHGALPMRWVSLGMTAGIALLLATEEMRGQSSGLVAFVDSLAAMHIDAGQVAGLSVGVVRGADTLVFKSYGYADLEWDVPMPLNAIHEIGSVTKQFTAVAMLQLWDAGKLDLDADITAYLPDYDTQGRSIPLRRLFDHSSGIKGYTEMGSFETIATRRLPRDSLVAMFAAVPLEFEPGTAAIYNNSAYFLLGLIIEKVSGQRYEEYLEDHVFPRAGMNHSSYCSNNAVQEGRAHGYQHTSTGLQRADHEDHIWPYAAGAICSTLGDLIAWNRALHGGQAISPEAYEMMITPQPLDDGTPRRYAMGLRHYKAPSGRVIEHGGGRSGFGTHSRYYPDEDVTVVVLVNTRGPPGPATTADAIGEHLFGDDAVPEAATFAGDLGRFVGAFRGPARGSTLRARVTVEGDTLKIQAGTPLAQPVEYLGGTTFFRGNLRFIFEMVNGEATALRMDRIADHWVLASVDEEAEAAVRAVVPEAILYSYVGTYELAPQDQIEVTLEDGQLFAWRLPLVADSETEFHLEVADVTIEFVKGEDGAVTRLILHQGGRTLPAEKIR